MDNNLGQILTFTIEGKFVNNVVEKGDGPTEMPIITDFAYDSQNNEIYVIGTGITQVESLQA